MTEAAPAAQRKLTTARLTLEPQLADHAEAMFAVLREPAIYAHENVPPPSVQALRERYAKLESRRSADGQEQWLNWVLRARGDCLIGYVQATVRPDGRAYVAYVLGPAHWGHGLAREAVAAMIEELAAHHAVHTVLAVFKQSNARSRRLLESLAFDAADAALGAQLQIEADEALMLRHARARAAKVPL